MEITEYFILDLSVFIILHLLGLACISSFNNKTSTKMKFGVYTVFGLVISFAISYLLPREPWLELQYIPFVIGSLYAGLSPLLAILNITLHGVFLGIDLGFWMTFLFSSVFGLLFWKISPWFLAQSIRRRILLLVQISLGIGILKIAFLGIFQDNYLTLNGWLTDSSIRFLGIGIVAYFLEQANKTLQLKSYIIETKKFETIEKMGATISHEIRNPLTAAIGFVQLLQSQSTSLETQSQYLSIIRNELKSAEKVVDNYLALAKQDKETFQPIHVELELYNVLKLLVPSAKENKVYISQYFSESHIIQANQQKFHQCFINLIKNAIESMPNGGTLLLEVIRNHNDVRIRIQDNGVGMTPEQISHLGEPYFSTKGDKGTGLGMLVVFNFIKEMNGTIHVHSEIGKGTTFEIMFSTSPNKYTESQVITSRNLVLS